MFQCEGGVEMGLASGKLYGPVWILEALQTRQLEVPGTYHDLYT